MRIKIDVQLEYRLAAPSAAILVLEAAGLADQQLEETDIDLRSPTHFGRVPAEEGSANASSCAWRTGCPAAISPPSR